MDSEEFPDYYRLLKVGDAASPEEIKRAYLDEQQFWHPDRFTGRPPNAIQRATQMSAKLNAAYAVLSDPEQRRAYDGLRLEWKEAVLEAKGFERITRVRPERGESRPPAPPTTSAPPSPPPPKQQQTGASDKEVRVLRFPGAYSVGTLWVCPSSAFLSSAGWFVNPDPRDHGTRFGPAQGDVNVSVAPGHWVVLLVDKGVTRSLESLPLTGIDAVQWGRPRDDLRQDFSHLSRLTQLKALDLDALFDLNQFRDEVLDYLRELAQLTYLNLSGLNISNAGLARVGHLSQLTHLKLAWTQITDAGLAHLSHLTALQRLDLSHTQVTDAGLARLGHLSELTHLNLTGPQITDAGLAHLSRLKLLEWLVLHETRVTREGLRRYPLLPQHSAPELRWAFSWLEEFIRGVGNGLKWLLFWVGFALFPFASLACLFYAVWFVVFVAPYKTWWAVRRYGSRDAICFWWEALRGLPVDFVQTVIEFVQTVKEKVQGFIVEEMWKGSRWHFAGYLIGLALAIVPVAWLLPATWPRYLMMVVVAGMCVVRQELSTTLAGHCIPESG